MVVLFALFLYYFIVSIESTLSNSEAFAIFTEGCIIPAFPLISENIKGLVGLPKKTIDCAKSYPLLISNESHIIIEEAALEHYNVMEKAQFYCCYQSFYAKKSMEDIVYESCIQFTDTIEGRHEFVRVECYYLDSIFYTDFFIFMKNTKTIAGKESNKFNVMIFGLESVSRINFLRTMPGTAKFLRDRGSVQLLGYNKLGDNSFPNLFPLLLGKSFKDENIYKYNNTIDTNMGPFVWDQYKRSGYVTALGSDSMAGLLGAYEYNLNNLPTDYYLLPFMYESRTLFKNKFYNYHMCYQNKMYYKTLLNYIYGLSRNLKDNNLFGIFWEESVSHEQLNYPHIMDSQYLNLLIKLESSGYLNETVVIFLSDHGMRWGKIVQTEQGRQEERLPLVEILLPYQFKSLYKLAYKNLQTNAHRLTTPFDMHATLIDLLDPTLLNDEEIDKRSESGLYDNQSSLFLPISKNRTCEYVGISDHWCTCYKGKQLPTGHKTRIKAAKFLIQSINSILVRFPQCHKLSIKNILDVSMVRDVRGSTFRVAVEANPGGGIFDGTLRSERGVWANSGTISRLNLYRGQSDCVTDISVKLYCYCKKP
ncbi:uncharacterized protein LOC135088147 [Ostrinia nubilalis]|uniref:uncharacterized protein LOC135088147 n=1 Tax=Ostrinia nubilalis TaxID=29057 RepID=UPI00308242FD